jgi:hypothetical protein
MVAMHVLRRAINLVERGQERSFYWQYRVSHVMQYRVSLVMQYRVSHVMQYRVSLVMQ